MEPDTDRWRDAEEDNMQASVEMPPSEDTPIQVSLARGSIAQTT